MKIEIYFLLLLSSLMIFVQCTSNPKVVEGTVSEVNPESHDFHGSGSHNFALPTSDQTVHTAEVVDILQAGSYTYLEVEEDGKAYWIATNPLEAEKGDIYHFKSGLMQTDFKSKDHDRVFDTLYLVSDIVSDKAGLAAHGQISEEEAPDSRKRKDIRQDGSIRIAELVSSKEKYADQSVQISGEVVKVNENIMGKNWVHLKDGSMDQYDLVVTTQQSVEVGEIVTLTGKVSLNKDFGAGYKYELIVEDGDSASL